jgi:RND family efflux transporter MFP subunit
MRKPPPESSFWSRLATIALMLPLFGALTAQAGEYVVERRTIPDLKAMFGQVEARDTAPARTRIGGTIVSRAVDEGAQVKAGDVIAVVADQKLTLAAQSLDAQLSALSSQLDNATAAFQRAADLLPRGFVTKAAYDQAKTNVDVLAHQIESMRSQRALVAQQMSEGEVLAPKAGRVLTMSAIPGAVVTSGETIARIAAGALYLRLSLPERHAALLKLGAPIALAPRGLEPGGPLGEAMRKGRIVKIYPEIDNGRVIADAEVDNLADYFIGERVRVYAPVGQREAMLIPRAAVTTRAGVDYVRILRPEGFLDVAIVFADADSKDEVEVLSGLRDGDKALVP